MLFLAACSGLGGEPRIVATFAPLAQEPDADAPSEHPDLALGAAIFAENCTRCHGETGRGDGQLVLSGQIPDPPPDFTDPATARDQTITAWFDVITNGRIEKLMPPWRESLSESERWAVAMYTYTMSYDTDELALGEELWQTDCASCHGDTGAGDGRRAAEFDTMVDLTSPVSLVGTSDSGLVNLLSSGSDDIHEFNGSLSEEDLAALVAFTRTLSLANTDVLGRGVPPPVETAEVEIAVAPEVQGTIRGQVVNGTEGNAAVPALTVTLRIIDSQLNQETFETTADEDGSFAFEDVTIRPDRAYIASTSYRDRTYSSPMITGESSSGEIQLPITVYETTSDTSVISVSGFVAQITETQGSLQVAQILNYSNTSDRVFSLDEAVDGGRYPSVRVPLPSGANVINTAGDTDRYILSSDGNALLDTQPVYPGQDHIIHVIYTLPYDGSAQIHLPLDYPLEGQARLLVEPGGLRVTSDQLGSLGTQSMGGQIVETYGADLSLPAGSTLTYEISGSAASQAVAVQPNNLLPYALIAAGSAFILVSAALYYMGRRTAVTTSNTDQLRQMLIEQIAELDDLNKKGQIDPAAYKERRDKLKGRLSRLMKEK